MGSVFTIVARIADTKSLLSQSPADCGWGHIELSYANLARLADDYAFLYPKLKLTLKF